MMLASARGSNARLGCAGTATPGAGPRHDALRIMEMQQGTACAMRRDSERKPLSYG